METINTHNTPAALYDVLARQFGETISRTDNRETRWVSIGCGSTTLTFFAARDGGEKMTITMPEKPTYEQRGAA